MGEFDTWHELRTMEERKFKNPGDKEERLAGLGTTAHREFVKIEGGRRAVIVTRNDWLAPDGKRVCEDQRSFTFGTDGDARWIDFDITIRASDGPVRFGDTKEGSMAIRLAPTMRLAGKVGKGHIVNSAGDKDGSTWGKRAAWCDYYGPVDGGVVGVAIFDHPENPRHPTWWHVRDYGLFAANPFGVSYFEKKDRGTGDLVVPAGESVTFIVNRVWNRSSPLGGNVPKGSNGSMFRSSKSPTSPFCALLL